MYITSTISDKHISFKSTEIVRHICTPMFSQSPVKFFFYGRNYKDGGAIRLHTDNEYFKTWLDNEHAWCPTFLKEGWYLWNDTHPNDQIRIREQDFNYGNGLTIINHYEDYSEIFGFAPESNDCISDLYLNDRQLFERFSYYFRERANKIIKQAEDSIIYLPNKQQAPTFIKKENNKYDPSELINALPVKMVEVPHLGKVTLSQRELMCFKAMLKGKTAKEIAESLSLSQKTIETYIIRMKNKFQCKTKSELINLAWQLGLVSSNGWLV